MATSTTGTGTLTLTSASAGFLSFSAAGVQNGDIVAYGLEDGNNREVGYGVYSSTGPTLTRATILMSTAGGAAINLSGNAEVFSTLVAEDMILIPPGAPLRPNTGLVQPYVLWNAVPIMSAASTPSGWTISASSEYSTTPAWKAFRENPREESVGWLTNSSQTGWIKAALPSAVTVLEYAIIGWSVDNWNTRVPNAWTLEGSNDGTNWTVLDTRTSQAATLTQWLLARYKVATPGSYSYYRFNVSANWGNAYMGINSLKLWTPTQLTGCKPDVFLLDAAGNSRPLLASPTNSLSGIGS